MIFFLIFIAVIFVVGTVAVFVDGSNFPQRKFRPKIIKGKVAEDRVGAHTPEPEDAT